MSNGTFVILAAGRGTRIGRVGEHLHKALVPLGGKAVLSHLLGLAPPGADVLVMVGHRAEQIENYLRLAHPQSNVRTVYVHSWDAPRIGGPGWSLLAAKPYVSDGPLTFTSCDTLWTNNSVDWHRQDSWLGVSPLPTGTPPERWCRVLDTGDGLTVLDKVSEPAGGWVHTGMGCIAPEALTEFWRGLALGGTVAGEKQMSAGFQNVPDLGVQFIDWLDVGDAEAYARAVELYDGYDWSKTSEATYILPEEGRVVKFHADQIDSVRYQSRAYSLGDTAPALLGGYPGWTAIEYVEDGGPPVMETILEWADEELWESPPGAIPVAAGQVASEFYMTKTLERVDLLSENLQSRVRPALNRVPWNELADGVIVSRIHGDLTRGNMLVRPDGRLVAFDWRPDFAGHTGWGDMRYDLAKLYTGGLVDWETARHGDFRPPADGLLDIQVIEEFCYDHDIEDVPLIAALCLLGSAPMHPAPFDEILVTRGLTLLDRCLGG